MNDLDRVRDRLRAAGSVCVLTGSGISSESGLPTFRGANGLWRTYRVEELASAAGFERDPQLVWSWYEERRAAHRSARPSAGHVALAELERHYADFTLATQNVDSLHLRAGSVRVLELHGSLREARCSRCDERIALDAPFPPSAIAHACGGAFRPDIVWFGESLPAGVFERAAAAAARADVVLVVGTSGMVNPAASLATRAPRADALVVEINPEETAITDYADVVLRGTASAFLPRLVDGFATERPIETAAEESVSRTHT
jgi:NAD-dependent deacetylase